MSILMGIKSELRNIIFVTIASLIIVTLSNLSTNDQMNSGLSSVRFKVNGKVQGVWFRKYTQRRAQELSLVGWVRNEDDGTAVTGIVQGDPLQIEQMKTWLTTTGSPHSRIDKAEFYEEKTLAKQEYEKFTIHR